MAEDGLMRSGKRRNRDVSWAELGLATKIGTHQDGRVASMWASVGLGGLWAVLGYGYEVTSLENKGRFHLVSLGALRTLPPWLYHTCPYPDPPPKA